MLIHPPQNHPSGETRTHRAQGCLVARKQVAKKFGLIGLLTWTLVGCSQETTPVVPVPTSPASTPGSSLLWGMVIDGSGVCIAEATVEVVRGQRLGQSIKQTTPCGAWDYDGGFMFKNLDAGVELTLRASAPGFATQEKAFVPSSGSSYQAVFVTLSRVQ